MWHRNILHDDAAQESSKCWNRLARLVQAIAESEAPKTLSSALGERERELLAVADRLLEKAPGTLTDGIQSVCEIAMRKLGNLRELIAHPEVSTRGALYSRHCV